MWAPSRPLKCCCLQKKKVFVHYSGPLNGILVPLMAKWSTKKKDLHPKFGDLKLKPGTLDGFVVFPKITKRSSTITRGPQMETGALRRLSGSLITLLWFLYDGPLKCSFMGSYTAMGPGQIAPCSPQAPLSLGLGGGGYSVFFVSLTCSWDDLFHSIRAKNVILVKSCQFRSASRSKMSSDCTPGIARDKFSPDPLWPRKIAAQLNKISLIHKNK